MTVRAGLWCWWRRVVVLVVSATVMSCGSGRSVESFCGVYDDETSRLAEKYEQQAGVVEGQDPLVGLIGAAGVLLEAQGDVVVLFDRLEETAPEDIAPDVGAVRDALQKQADATASGDLGEMFFANTVAMVQVNGAATRVDAYILANCQ